jgi:hypothetical protein
MGGQIAGVKNPIDNPFSAPTPDRRDFAATEMDPELRSRYLAIIDKYMVDKGMVRDVAPMSAAGKSDQRGQYSGAPVNRQGKMLPMAKDGQSSSGRTPALPDPEKQRQLGSQQPPVPITESPLSSEPAVSSQMANMVVAPIKQGQPAPLTTNNAFFQEDNRRKQDEFNQVKDFVYRDRRR